LQKYPDYQLKKIYNREKYLLFMKSKTIIRGEDRTDTILDYMTEAQILGCRESGQSDLSEFDPTPKHIKDHTHFVSKIYNKLLEQFPDDKYLINLDSEDNFDIKFNSDWYVKYGISYKD